MFEYIDNNQKLTALLERLQAVEWVTLDTEFIREKTYFPRLCLIQVGADGVLACVDPLLVEDMQPFYRWLLDSACVKVLHAAWQDMEIFHHVNGSLPAPVFDTQIAAAALGMGDQLGYARLVEHLLGAVLDKSQSRTDWARRPLTAKQINYAIDDVRYLRDIYLMLNEQLQQSGRMKWLEKSFRKLTDPATYEVDPWTIWQRVKGVQFLKPQHLAVLRELAAWREQRALRKDIPRRWVLSDEVLTDMARMQPEDVAGLQQIRGLGADQAERWASEWLTCITRGKSLPNSEWPQLPRRRKLTAEMNIVADLLMAVLNQIAYQNGISAQMIATRPQIEKMLEEDRGTLSEDWRGAMVNDAFAQILNGQACVRVENQHLVIGQPTSIQA